jgi:SAM-dependent methyltransferase
MNQRVEYGLSFGPAAGLYDAIRPSYPSQAVAWALAPLGPGRWTIADVGAGTGIMTRLLLAAGHDVVCVEPDAQMRSHLIETTREATAIAGSAEALPLPDACLDGAVAAQAYHWFDEDQANAELARVIRPGGVFAAIWNDRDEDVPWVAAYSEIIAGDRSPHASPGRHVTTYGDGFEPVAEASFRQVTVQTAEGLVRLLHSRSYYLCAAPSRQRSMTGQVRELVRTHPDLAGRSSFELPYVTLVYRAVRSSSRTPGADRSE